VACQAKSIRLETVPKVSALFHKIEAQTANEAWLEAAALLRPRITRLHANPLGGGSREIHHVALSIERPRQRWVFARRPPINPAFALAEVVWILRGRNDAAFLTHWNKELPVYAGSAPQLHGAYGFRLRRHFGLDQLSRVARVLSGSPPSRQVVLQVWDARTDLPDVDGTPVSADIPCNVLSCLKVVGGCLEWLQIIRSNDLFLGLPYNIIQWTTLQEVLAGWIGVQIGSYNQVSDSLHVYDRNASLLEGTDSSIYAENSDSISLPMGESELSFRNLESCLERLLADGTSAIPELLKKTQLAPSFRNWLILFCAEQYRRGRDSRSSIALIAECTNPALSLAWQRWNERWRSLPVQEEGTR
jgi:thymidylate synthase